MDRSQFYGIDRCRRPLVKANQISAADVMDRSIVTTISYMRSALSACSFDGLGSAFPKYVIHVRPSNMLIQLYYSSKAYSIMNLYEKCQVSLERVGKEKTLVLKWWSIDSTFSTRGCTEYVRGQVR